MIRLDLRVLGWGLTLAFAIGCTERSGVAPASAPPRSPSAASVAQVTDAAAASSSRSNSGPEKVQADHLPNSWRIHPKVISGGLPEGDAAFQELADLGVKSIISVDGATPDVGLAKKYGLRYVHMPHGYDGIPEERAKELAKAVRDLPGPIYIHCHHGKHRSPAAATVACVGAGFLTPASAVGVLKIAGTSENYRGLYQSAQSARRLDDALLDALRVDFPESVTIPPIADAMIAIEHLHDRLKALGANQWRSLPDQPDLDSAHEALLLREQYTELLRTDEVARQPEGFRDLLLSSESTARKLEELLMEWRVNGSLTPAPDALGQALAAVSKSCTECHATYRDVPLGEK